MITIQEEMSHSWMTEAEMIFRPMGVDISSYFVFMGAFNCESLKGRMASIIAWSGTEPPMSPVRLWN